MHITKQIFFSLLISIFVVSCGQQNAPTENIATSEKNNTQVIETTRVSSSIIPLSSVINTIGWDYVEVNNIVPAGVSPHGFDLSAQQMVDIEKSAVVFLTWLEHIDGFMEKAVPEEKQIHLADGIVLLESSGHDDHGEDEHTDEEHADNEHHEDEEEHSKEEHHEDTHSDDAHNKDPHVWLGKKNITVIAQKIRDDLSVIMPEHAAYFSANTESFITQLNTLYSDFEFKTSGKTPQEFIVFHDAYNYLMDSVWMNPDLKVPFSQNVLHETWTAHMVELIEEVEVHWIKYVFKEPQFSDNNLEKFADEYNLTLATLDPLGTDPTANGYINNISANLTALSNIYE